MPKPCSVDIHDRSFQHLYNLEIRYLQSSALTKYLIAQTCDLWWKLLGTRWRHMSCSSFYVTCLIGWLNLNCIQKLFSVRILPFYISHLHFTLTIHKTTGEERKPSLSLTTTSTRLQSCRHLIFSFASDISTLSF